MGFGLLFIGYIMTMLNVPMLGMLGTLIRIGGCAIMICAVLKLRRYCKAFDLSLVGVALMAAISVILLAVNVDGFLYDNLITSDKLITDFAKNVIGYTEQGVSFVFNSLLLWGVLCIARETEVKKIANGAIRNYVFVCAYYMVYLASFLPLSGIRAAQSEFALITWVLYFVWIGLNLWLLFSCYAQICDEDDVEMDKRPINISAVNKLMDAFDKKAQKARADDALYRQEKRKKKEEKKKRRK
ncbi:MAG: hypothetical protein IJ011_08710 [Clostridia bacterium]|nr:hypothetical protein [Clostridia bacterium]